MQAEDETNIDLLITILHLLIRLIPPIIESSYKDYIKFFWTKKDTKIYGELLCCIIIKLFFKTDFCVTKNPDGIVTS